jgi:hypothetical protein
LVYLLKHGYNGQINIKWYLLFFMTGSTSAIFEN